MKKRDIDFKTNIRYLPHIEYISWKSKCAGATFEQITLIPFDRALFNTIPIQQIHHPKNTFRSIESNIHVNIWLSNFIPFIKKSLFR